MIIFDMLRVAISSKEVICGIRKTANENERTRNNISNYKVVEQELINGKHN